MRALSALSFILLLSAPAFAADLGTYRPGNAYNSVSAAGADVCQSHCAGDAQCRGWNYVKANPRVQGVCEFLSTVSAPISSPIAISGLGVSAVPATPNLLQGRANTVRVGTSVAPRAQNSVTRVGNRRVVREPVPQRAAPQKAATRRIVQPSTADLAGESLTAQQNRYRQQGQTQPQPVQQAARPTATPQRLMRDPRITARRPAPQQAPAFRPMLDGAHPQAYRQPMPQQQSPYQGRPPVGQPISPQLVQQPMQQQAQPRLTREQALKQRQAALIAQSRQAAPPVSAQPLTAEQAQQSLYGSLHDDVKVPAANSAVPQDKNVPIATAASRPTIPVQTEALRSPVQAALAGAPVAAPKE